MEARQGFKPPVAKHLGITRKGNRDSYYNKTEKTDCGNFYSQISTWLVLKDKIVKM